MNSVSINGQNHAIIDYKEGDYIPSLDIQNIEKMIGMQYPFSVNSGNWETVIKVHNITTKEPYYSITIFYGVDVLDGKLSFRLYKSSVGYVFHMDEDTKPIKKPVFEIVTEDRSLYNAYLISDDCKTPDRFLRFIYVSLEKKIFNSNLPF